VGAPVHHIGRVVDLFAEVLPGVLNGQERLAIGKLPEKLKAHAALTAVDTVDETVGHAAHLIIKDQFFQALAALEVPQQGIHLAATETTQVVAIETIQVAKNLAETDLPLQYSL